MEPARIKKSPKARGEAFPLRRAWVQAGFLTLTLAMGLQFWIYVNQVSGTGAITVARPPGVEGFLPIGALMAWKRFFLTGLWDHVHPAAMVLLGYAALVSLVFPKAFCGWVCPVGTVSEYLARAGKKLFGRIFLPPRWLDLPLRSLKYGLLGLFAYAVYSMNAARIGAFLESPYYSVSDVKMLHFFTRMTGLTAFVLVILALGSLAVSQFWCRYLCPYGALMGLFGLVSPNAVRRNKGKCTDCGLCDKACAFSIPVSRRERVRDSLCMGCLDCVDACPHQALKLSAPGKGPGREVKAWSPAAVGLVACLLLVACVYGARITGKWRGSVTDMQRRAAVQIMDYEAFTHPRSFDLSENPEHPTRRMP